MIPSLHMGSMAERTSAVDLIQIQANASANGPGWGSSAADLVNGLVKCLTLPGQQHRPLHAASASALATFMHSTFAAQISRECVQEMQQAAEKLCEEDAGKARTEAQQLLSVLAAQAAGKSGDFMSND